MMGGGADVVEVVEVVQVVQVVEVTTRRLDYPR